MAQAKDYGMIAVITGLTQAQAADLTAEIMKTKESKAPGSRGTIVKGKSKDIGSLIQKKTPQITSSK